MTKASYRLAHRYARQGNLGSLACSLTGGMYLWFLQQVYGLRFPRIGSRRHLELPRSFDTLRGGIRRLGKRHIVVGGHLHLLHAR